MIFIRQYELFYTRVMPLYCCQYWYRAEKNDIPETTGGKGFFEPLFWFRPGLGTGVYYMMNDPDKGWENYIKFYVEHPVKYEESAALYRQQTTETRELIKSGKLVPFTELFLLAQKLWIGLAISVVLAESPEMSGEFLSAKAMELRRETDAIIYDLHDFMQEALKNELGEHMHLLDYLTIEEIQTRKFPPSNVIADRQRGYFYFRGELLTEISAKQLEKKYSLILPSEAGKEDATFIKGRIAHPGIVNGRVRILLAGEDHAQLEQDEILVTYMTTPDFMPAMHRAKAFITDEGGITCHAAIVAREMKKPCIIGTKVATSVLKDGDMIEVDADKGVIKILKRA